MVHYLTVFVAKNAKIWNNTGSEVKFDSTDAEEKKLKKKKKRKIEVVLILSKEMTKPVQVAHTKVYIDICKSLYSVLWTST